MTINERSKWVLLLIGLTDWIEGATRLQKYAFFGSKNIKGLTRRGFYNDWIPCNYGPFSRNIAEDIKILLKEDFVRKNAVKGEHNLWVDRFSLNDKGREEFEKFRNVNDKFANELQKIVKYYERQTLMGMIHDVYYLFPEYAIYTRIKSQVGRQSYESDYYLNPQHD